jgi:hypothetical protein
MTRSACEHCGALPGEAAFAVKKRRPSGSPRLCEDCKLHDLEASRQRVAARKAEIAHLRTIGKFRAAKPIHTAPLFAALRP